MPDTDLPLNAWADKEGIEPPDLGLTSAPDQAAQEVEGSILGFDHLPLQHNVKYENNQSNTPCGCYYCQTLRADKE